MILSFQPQTLFCSEPYQRIAWEALKKSVNSLVNKITMVTPVCLPCDVITVTGECVQHCQYSKRIILREHYQRKVSNCVCVCVCVCVRVYMWYRITGKLGRQKV